MTTTVHRRHFTVEDQAANRYPELDFDLTGEQSVEVTLDYDTDAAVVDLGCLDPERWRGWSGGARSRFVIARDGATPGYEPGEMPRGRWAVVLGLHAVPDEGIDVVVTITSPAEGGIEVAPDGPAPEVARRGSQRGLPAPPGLTWFAGDFHSHSEHSDGDRSLAQLAHGAAVTGLDLLAVTDHNTVSHHPHLAAASGAYDLTLLPGQEITTSRGHANAFGDIGWIDFRRPAEEWGPEVARRGGLLSINHPLEGDCSWQHPLTELPPALEMWHIGWFRDLASMAMWSLWSRWRQDVVLLGGSDFHKPSQGWPPGTPTTWVLAADRSPEALMEAVVAGRTALSRTPFDSPALVRVDGDLVAIDADGAVLVDIDGRRRLVHGNEARWDADSVAAGPYRIETAQGSLLAISR